MKIALRYMGRKHVFRELPETFGVCHTFKPTTPGPLQRINVRNIPFGKRYFECDPCKDHLVCDPLIARSTTPQVLRDSYRIQCCK